jgi:hypothetical protein
MGRGVSSICVYVNCCLFDPRPPDSDFGIAHLRDELRDIIFSGVSEPAWWCNLVPRFFVGLKIRDPHNQFHGIAAAVVSCVSITGPFSSQTLFSSH